MSYVSLYRKYRSQLFDDVVGQEHVTRTLQNAIKAGRVGHAYLFCGSRGTGKTTVARLLAKALNCEKGPTPEPCNKCEACLSITEGSAVDVVEMDAASHRGVDDMDALRDGVKYPPMRLRYKVYIIDEAHQLSAHAKDAFLKTLEEPPAHAIFVLATTESHEIPMTIRSRCQLFDFRRGSLSDIGQRLNFVAESEGVEIEPDALDILAKGAGGSYRDGLSILEQVMAFCDNKISAKDVNTVLGAVETEALFEVADVIAEKDSAGAFSLAERLMSEGKDVRELLRAISTHFRNLLFAQAGAGSDGENTDRLKVQSGRFSRYKLVSLVEIFASADKETRWTDQHRLLLEMALLKGIEAPDTRVAVAPAVAPAQPRYTDQPVYQPEPVPVQSSTPAQTPRRKPTHPVRKASPVEQPEQAEVVQKPRPDYPEGGVTLEEVRSRWHQVIKAFRGSKDASVHALLLQTRPIRVDEGVTVVVGFPEDRAFARDQFDIPRNIEACIRTLEYMLRKRIKIQTETIQAQTMEEEELPPIVEEAAEGGTTGSLLDAVLTMFPGSTIEGEEFLETDENFPVEDDEDA